MNYKEKLLSPVWQKKRLLIFQRDNFTCVRCGANDKELHVHHEKYLKGCEPWEYPDELLITLCHTCHTKKHLPEPKGELSRDAEVVRLSEPITVMVLDFYKNQISKQELCCKINEIDEPKLRVLNALALALKSDTLRQLGEQDAAFYITKYMELNEVKMAFIKEHKINAVVLAA